MQWTIVGLSKSAVEQAVETLNAVRPAVQEAKPASSVPASAAPNASPTVAPPARVRVSQGVTQGLIISKVAPIYPQEAKSNRIQGTVRMSAVISKAGEVTDLEVLEGPIELVVSAVNAVRQWKYRPYVINGDPVEVQTQITVIYKLSGF